MIDGLVQIAAIVPWWVGVALAVVCYLAIHRFAVVDLPMLADAKPGEAGAFAGRQMIRSLGYFAQYLLPAIFLAAAAASAIERGRRARLASGVSGEAPGEGDATWKKFEFLLIEGFRLEGFAVTERGSVPPIAGVDFELTKGQDRFLVQCKHWRATSVGVAPLRELHRIVAESGAAGGFVVTSGGFTDDAAAYANGHNIELMNGRKLLALLLKVRNKIAASLPARA